MKRLVGLLFVLTATVVLGAAMRCHSEKYYLAKAKLDRMVLTPSQSKEIEVFAKDFEKKWSRTHRELGCSHHEDYADEFIAAASGVLSDDQFKKFRGRGRDEHESLDYRIRGTQIYVQNLLTICRSL